MPVSDFCSSPEEANSRTGRSRRFLTDPATKVLTLHLSSLVDLLLLGLSSTSILFQSRTNNTRTHTNNDRVRVKITAIQ